MQAIILAAGMGKRLKNKTQNHTKSMVKILGKTFLEHSLDKLTKFNITRIIIVTGFCGDEIKSVIKNSYNGIPVIYVENKVYDKTNNIYSLYLAKDYFVEEDTILLESDLIYEEKILDKLLNNPFPNLAVVDRCKPYMDGTVVSINDENEITAFIPKEHFNIKNINEYYKTANIYKFSKEFIKEDYLPFLEAYYQTMGENQYYEQVLRVLLSLEKHNLRALKLNGEKWYEVDDLQDYDIAETIFCEDLTRKYDNLTKRYGGFWRFDGIKDFYYLTNPYFPTDRMLKEIKNCCYDLLVKYPSGQKTDRVLLANIFNVEENQVVLGNGAAELINTIMPKLEGEIGIILPTFQEYPARLNKKANPHYFIPKNKDFSYTKEDLINFSKEIDTLILVNPDNPSGNYIDKTSVIDILDYFKINNKKLILDESFVDFVDGSENNTLIDSFLLKKYKNLVVIKSLSKSYGIAGIRLGVMASGDSELTETMRKSLPVWNINSFGEFFLQILNKYKKNYFQSCRKIVLNRNEVFDKLLTMPFIRPSKSCGNYILCELNLEFSDKIKSSKELCVKMFEQNILIKDCSDKMGFEGKNYIRIAINSKEDNDLMLSKLKAIYEDDLEKKPYQFKYFSSSLV